MSKVGILMGSNSDLGVMEKAMGVLEDLGVSTINVVSAIGLQIDLLNTQKR